MKILIIRNYYDEGEQEHLFCLRDNCWSSMFLPCVSLVDFLLECVDELDEEDFTLPNDWRELLRGDAAKGDAGEFFSKLRAWSHELAGLTRFGDWEVSDDIVSGAHLFCDRETSTLIAALRFLQQQRGLMGADISDIATGGGSYDMLNEDEIDTLCEKLNLP